MSTASFVDIYDPDRAESGYTLLFYKRRQPTLIDMNGNVVHSWPQVRAIDRLRLSPEGHLLTIGLDRSIREYDWHGNEIWDFSLTDSKDFPHHDLIRLANGNVLLSYRSSIEKTDYFLEVTPEKEVAWSWDSKDHLSSFEREVRLKKDPTHINSIQELPENRFFDAGDTRFRPGNILASARELNTIFIVDRKSGDITWQFHQGLDSQHEAQMVGPGYPNSGSILVFNNNLRGVYRKRSSEIFAINPTGDAEIAWSFSTDFFFSSVGGTQQALPNGNLLVTSTAGGRIFEIDRSGNVVWQWSPKGWLPMRAYRYPYDYSPLFEQFSAPVETAVANRYGGPFVSRELTDFKTPTLHVNIGGKSRRVIKHKRVCRPLAIPPRASLNLSYGIEPKKLSKAPPTYSASFKAFLILPESQTRVSLISHKVTSKEDLPWVERQFPLEKYAFQTVNLCLRLSTKKIPKNLEHSAAWEVPVIRTSGRNVEQTQPEAETQEIDEVLKQRLEALGYVE